MQSNWNFNCIASLSKIIWYPYKKHHNNYTFNNFQMKNCVVMSCHTLVLGQIVLLQLVLVGISCWVSFELLCFCKPFPLALSLLRQYPPPKNPVCSGRRIEFPLWLLATVVFIVLPKAKWFWRGKFPIIMCTLSPLTFVQLSRFCMTLMTFPAAVTTPSHILLKRCAFWWTKTTGDKWLWRWGRQTSLLNGLRRQTVWRHPRVLEIVGEIEWRWRPSAEDANRSLQTIKNGCSCVCESKCVSLC